MYFPKRQQKLMDAIGRAHFVAVKRELEHEQELVVLEVVYKYPEQTFNLHDMECLNERVN